MFQWKKMGLLPLSLIGIGAVTVLTVLLCLVFTAPYLHGLMPLETGPVCAAASAGLAVFIVVFILGRARGRQAMSAGGIIAGGTILLAALICALGGKGFDFGPWLLHLSAAAAAGGVIGAVMSIRPHTKNRRRHHR